MKSMLFLILVVSNSAALAQNQSDAVIENLKRIDQQWQESIIRGDAQFVEQRTADDFVFTHDGGRIQKKEDFLSQAKRGAVPAMQRKVSKQSVELHGDMALVFGRLDVHTPARNDQAPICYALQYVHLYAQRNKEWTFLSHHTTQMVEPAHPCSQTAAAGNPFEGTWEVNVQKSKMANPRPQRETVKMQAIDNGLEVIREGLDSEGKPTHAEYVYRFGGKDYPDKSGRGTLACTRLDANSFTCTRKRDAKELGQSINVISNNGTTGIFIMTGIDPQGQGSVSAQVYEKK